MTPELPTTPSSEPSISLPSYDSPLAFLDTAIHPASLAFFRIAFGLLMLMGALRFGWYGWIESLYILPPFHFSFLEGIRPWPGMGMTLHFGVMAVCAVGVALGCFYRLSMVGFFLTFTYVELLDKAAYLNHYYLISLLSFLMIFMPLHRAYSVDNWRYNRPQVTLLPAWPLWVIRLQVGLVYFFAGVAKLKPDWLFDAQPLKTWLLAHDDFPVLGALFTLPATPYLMSWAGALFDLSALFFLLWHRTRLFAWIVVVCFHVLTWSLFNIGLFPWIMIGCSLIFFDPDWPLQLQGYVSRWTARRSPLNERSEPPSGVPPVLSPVVTSFIVPSLISIRNTFLVVWFLIQCSLPLRHLLYPGNVLWTEEGMRFAWHVMLVEKSGQVDFQVRDPSSGRVWWVNPRSYLSDLQVKAMSTQPDMMLQFAHHLEQSFRGRGYTDVQVFARAQVALTGRTHQPLIDPTVDLTLHEDGLKPKSWILPLRE